MLKNPLLEARVTSVREGLNSLAGIVDENLDVLVLRLTGEGELTAGCELKPIAAVSKTVCEKFLLLVALEHPMAGDLKYALAALRVEHDYERIHELLLALNKRIDRLCGTPMQEVVQDMTAVMSDLLKFHRVVRRTWEPDPQTRELPDLQAELARLSAEIHAGIHEIQSEVMKKLAEGSGHPATSVELVLACRHIKRIAGLLDAIPAEIHSFDRPTIAG